MKSYTLEGIVIKRSNFGEADRLITLFTKQHGKVITLAKGTRKISSKRGGSLELFNLVKCQVTDSRGRLDILTEVQIIESFSSWRKYLGRVALAYQLCELVDKTTPEHEEHQEIFNILCHAFSQISSLGVDWDKKIKDFELQILVELGYWPENKIFTGDIKELIEEVSSRPFYSPKLLNYLKR